MKLFSMIIAVVIGLMVYNTATKTYADYKREQAVSQCKSESQAPEWAVSAVDWACDTWAK